MPAFIGNSDFTVAELVPHAAPMLLLQDVLSFGTDFCVASVVVQEDSIFFQSGKGVPAYVGIEYMAQTIALWSGIQMRQQGKPPAIGFLLGTRKYQTGGGYFPAGAVLTVRVEQTYRVDGMGVFACTLHEGDVLRAHANVNVFEPGEAKKKADGNASQESHG